MDFIKTKISGGHTLVSPEDYHLIEKFAWFADSDGYATAFTINDEGKVKVVRLHQLVAGKRQGMVTDHINRVRLDNRRENLRLLTKAENRKNNAEQTYTKDTPFQQWELLERGAPYDKRTTVVRNTLRKAKVIN